MTHRKVAAASILSTYRRRGWACVIRSMDIIATRLESATSVMNSAAWVNLGCSLFITKTNIPHLVSNIVAFSFDIGLEHPFSVWLLSWPFQIRLKLYRRASCAADSVDSVSPDKPNWVLMSVSWGNVPGLIVMAFIGHFLPSMKPSCHGWFSVITKSMTDGTNKPNACGESNSYRGRASLMSSLLFHLFDVTPSGEHISALDQRHYSPIDSMWATEELLSAERSTSGFKWQEIIRKRQENRKHPSKTNQLSV